MKVTPSSIATLAAIIQSGNLLNEEELSLITNLAKEDFSFAPQLAIADSVHYHIHVPDVEQLPHQLFIDNDGVVENKKEGYIKYGFPGNIKLIFSHIPVAQKEQPAKCLEKSYLDHIGIDIRSEKKSGLYRFSANTPDCSTT